MGMEAWKHLAKGKGNVLRRQSKSNTLKSSSVGGRSRKGAKKKTQRVEGFAGAINRNSPSETAEYRKQRIDEERRWRAESDLNSLQQVQQILDSPERVKAAKAVAQEKVRVAQEAAESVNKIGR